MSRIRSIHPGLASDEAFMSMSMPAKAGWPMLWTECDDHGMFEWKPLVLKARIFPADNVDFAELLAEYEALGNIMRVEVDGKPYGLVRNFSSYQRPKNPSYRFPFRDEFRKFIGMKTEESTDPPPVLPQPSASPPENPSQMKEEGWGRKIEPIAQHLEPARAALPKNWLDLALEANGLGTGFREERHIGLMNPAPFQGLLAAGFDFFEDMLAAIRAKPNPNARSWGYFDGQIRDFVTVRSKAAKTPRPAMAPTFDWRKALEVYREGTWADGWGPKPGERGCKAPSSLLAEFGYERAA